MDGTLSTAHSDTFQLNSDSYYRHSISLINPNHGSANLGLFLSYKKLFGGDFRAGHLSQISTPAFRYAALMQI